MYRDHVEEVTQLHKNFMAINVYGKLKAFDTNERIFTMAQKSQATKGGSSLRQPRPSISPNSFVGKSSELGPSFLEH